MGGARETPEASEGLLPAVPARGRRVAADGGALAVPGHARGRRGPRPLGDQVGDLSVGRQFDAVWVGAGGRRPLDVVLDHAQDADDALAKVFALAGPADVRGVWVDGGRRN